MRRPKKAQAQTPKYNGRTRDLLNKIESAIESAEDLARTRVGSRGGEFGENTLTTLRGIRDTIRSTGTFTFRQERAVARIANGLDAWVNR